MAAKKLKDAQAKKILLKWPTRTKALWPAPGGHGYWIRGQPKQGRRPGPKLSSPGADLFTTQPDGLWIHFAEYEYVDLIAVEVCGTIQNLNDKRSRYIPASHSLVLNCSRKWLEEPISVQRGGNRPRWQAAASMSSPNIDLYIIPVRHLRVLYALPKRLYETWCRQHTPTGYEFFCPHSSLDSYSSKKMQTFLAQLSIAAQFYTRLG